MRKLLIARVPINITGHTLMHTYKETFCDFIIKH